jgi:hypothetical protein
MTAPHLPPDVPLPPAPLGVLPLGIDLGEAAGHRMILLSLEVWSGWCDLRFARIDQGSDRPLPRRVPPTEAWLVVADGEPVEVLDAVGRGDRSFSNGEVRLRPVPASTERLQIAVQVVPNTEPLSTTIELTTDLPGGDTP